MVKERALHALALRVEAEAALGINLATLIAPLG
jgi:hypothetical protein